MRKEGLLTKAETKRALLTVAALIGLLAALQLIHFGLKQAFFLFVERTNFSDRVASLAAMALVTAALLAVCRRKGVALSVLPARFGPLYIAATALFGALLIATPILTRDTAPAKLLLLFYSAIVTPVYEELIFRGFVWNKLEACLAKPWAVYAVNALLFALWHLGCADALAFRVGAEGLANALLWKAITGLGFGLVLGALRLKTRNCYAAMLLHGAMNIFGR